MNLGGEGKKKKSKIKKLYQKEWNLKSLIQIQQKNKKMCEQQQKKRTKKNNVVNRGGEGIREVRTMKLNQ